MRLEDIVTIVVTMIELFVALVVAIALYALWPRPWSDLVALIRHGRKYGYVSINFLPCADGSPAEIAGSRSGSDDLVLAQQSQENQEPVRGFDDVIAVLSEHKLTSEQAADVLAVMRRENGEYFISANKIRDIVGGADKVIKARVAIFRPQQSRPKPAAHLDRPANGW